MLDYDVTFIPHQPSYHTAPTTASLDHPNHVNISSRSILYMQEPWVVKPDTRIARVFYPPRSDGPRVILHQNATISPMIV